MSHKWHSTYKDHPDEKKRAQFEQVLSQANYYMKEFKTRYGFVLTGQELVAIRRRGENGNLDLAKPVLFNPKSQTWEKSGVGPRRCACSKRR